ncbi:unnamed protein product [Thelazia callipaeda]|uniref:G protein-coupled receptor n=1 Tax=Thelazia callipaeda TaxID=103827 RepID=A0A0N5D8T3_THECL|nr:unnamed protein product [Thelazia callipaeda]
MDSCQEESELAHSQAFRNLLISIAVISALAVIAELWAIKGKTSQMLLHQNTRMLLIVHQIWLIIHCIARIIAYVYVMITYHKHTDNNCDHMMSLRECFMIRTLVTLTIFLNAISIPAIVIERAIATYFTSTYEKIGNKIGVTLVTAQVFETILSDRIRRENTQLSLSQRYQIKENIMSIQTMLPLLAFQSLFLTIFLTAILLNYLLNFNLTTKRFAFYIEGLLF